MKKLEINNITYNFPENFDELLFGDFENCLIIMENHPSSPKITHDLVLDILSFLGKIDKKLLTELPKSVYLELYKTISFIFYEENLKEIKLKAEYNIDGEVWVYSDDPNCLTKEFVDREVVLTEFPEEKRLSGLIAIFLRPKGKSYSSEDLEERINKIKNQKTTEIYPLIAFFLARRNLFTHSMNLYSIMLANFQSRQVQIDNFLKSTDGTASFWNWRKKISKILTIYLKEKYSKCLTYYHTLQTSHSLKKIN